MKVLIVEDNHQFRKFLRGYVTHRFSGILECGNANEAFEIYCTEQPDMVLMDIALPGETDGIAVTNRIKAFDSNAKIIIITSFDEQDLRQAAADAGAIGYVLKDDLRLLNSILEKI